MRRYSVQFRPLTITGTPAEELSQTEFTLTATDANFDSATLRFLVSIESGALRVRIRVFLEGPLRN